MSKDPSSENTSSGHSEATHDQGRGPEAEAGADNVQSERPPLSPAAQRALAEAEARRKARYAEAQTTEAELGGRGGADPARFGDWEINGRAIDF